MTSIARLRTKTTTTNNENQPRRVVDATGKRTGVNILSKDIPVQANGFEDPDAFFSHAATPQAKENPTTAPAKFTRFSLGSGQKNDDSSSTAGRTRRLMSRVKYGSPSELSRVSTASASPVPATQQQKKQRASISSGVSVATEDDPPLAMHDDPEDEEQEEESPQPPPMEEEDEEQEFATQPEEEEEEEDALAAKQALDSQNAEASVVEDDFMPPGPPDSPERDDESYKSEIPSQRDLRTHASTIDTESAGEEEEDSPGFAMPTTKTPQSAMALRKEKKRHKKEEPKTKKSSKKRKKAQVVETSDDENAGQPKPKKKKATKKKSRYATVFSPKGYPLPMEYETVPVDTLRHPQEEEEHDGKVCRRSKRARCPPLAYWKNEKLQYGPSDDMDANSDVAKMPVPKAVIKAKATPYKPRTVRHRIVSANGKKKSNSVEIAADEAPPAEFDSSKLRKKYDYVDDETAGLWDDDGEEAKDIKVVAYKSRVEYHKLPLSKDRTKAEGNVVGKAAQAFSFVQPPNSDYVGYIMGNLVLPPRGIKDAESVGSCAQVFTVVSGQPGAVEVAYADPEECDNGVLKPESAFRFLLGPGDMFRVPPGNCYRLQNHSKTTECFLTWTIIRPHASAVGESR